MITNEGGPSVEPLPGVNTRNGPADESPSMGKVVANAIRVKEKSPSMALGPANMAGIMSGDALSRIKDPRRLAQVMSRISRDFDELRVRNERQLLGARKLLSR